MGGGGPLLTGRQLNIRRFGLDVDKALKEPSIFDIAAAIHGCAGVKSSNITVEEVDQETVGTRVIIEGDRMDYDEISRAIESSGAVVHNLDELVCGENLVQYAPRAR